MRLGQWVLALSLCCSLAAQAGDAAKAHDQFKKGKAALDAKKAPEALAAFKASYAESSSPSLLFFLGEAYRLSGDSANALTSYEEYLVKDPNGPEKAKAEAQVAALKAKAAPAMKKVDVAELDLDLGTAPAKAPSKKKGGKQKKPAAAEAAPPAQAAAAKPPAEAGPASPGAGGDLALDFSPQPPSLSPPASSPKPPEPKPAEVVKAEVVPNAPTPAAPATKPAAPPVAPTTATNTKPPASSTPSKPALVEETPAARKAPGFKLSATLSAGVGILNHPTYYSLASSKVSDSETAFGVGLDVEAGWRFGALSLGLQVETFTSGSPEIFGKDLLVPFTVGPRLEYAAGIVRLGLSGSYAIAPKTYWLGFDGGFGADLGLQFGSLGVRLTSGALFGSGAYLTQAGGSLKTSHTVLVPVRIGLVWEH